MLRSSFFKLSASNYNVICHGNSLTFGVNSSGGSARWPSVMSAQAPMLATGVAATNSGVSGQTIVSAGGNGNMTATAPTAVDALLQAGKTNVLFAWEFVNELGVTALDVAGAKSAWVAYCNARRAAAASAGRTLKIVTCTVPPGKISAGYPAVANPDYCVALKTVNSWMRGNYKGFADYLCDFAADPIFDALWTNGTFSDADIEATGIYSADRLHFKDSGYALIGNIGANRMRQLPL